MVEKIRILDVGVNVLTLEQLLQKVDSHLANQKSSVFSYVNAHAINLATTNERFKTFLNTSNIVYCDGFGVRLAAKMLGYPPPPRYSPPDFIDKLLEKCATNGYSIFFLGAEPGIAAKMAEMIKGKFPSLNIRGTFHGFLNKTLSNLENESVIRMINALPPDT